MKTKQQRKAEAWEEYKKIIDPAWEEYLKKCKAIDEEPVKKCKHCGSVLEDE